MEYSLQSREIEGGLLATARELGVAVVAYSPLGRGMLSQTYTSRDALPEGDWRRSCPRFSEEAAAANFGSVASLSSLALRKGCTPAQLALAWLLAKGADIFPIPGSKGAARAVENARAATIELTAVEVAEVEAAVPPAVGDRYANKHGQFEARE